MKKITLLMIALLAVMTLHAQPLKVMTDADMEMMLGKPHAPVAGLKMASYPNQTLARALPRARQALTIEEYVGTALVSYSLYKLDDSNQLVKDDPFQAGRPVEIKLLSDTSIAIYNMFSNGSELYVEAQMDFDSGKFTIPSGQTVYEHSTYGKCTMKCMQVKTSGTDITGEIYGNGVVEFDDVWALVVQEGSYAGHYFVPMYACTYLELPNATFEGTLLGGTTITAPVAVYQYDDLVYVNNLAGYGMPSTLIDLNNTDYTFNMSQQKIFDWFDTEDARSADPLYNVYPASEYLGDYYSYAATFANGELANLDGTTVTGKMYPDSLVFDPWAMYASADYYVGFVTSKITYTDGNKFCEEQSKGLRGDADGNGEVKMPDLTMLIDYILNGSAEGIVLENADCNSAEGDGNYDLQDVNALIDYLLNGKWSDE